jgi:predicted methyltransferase
VIDHQGNSDNDNASLHRIEVALVIETLEKAGFKIEQSELLSNPEDTRDKGVFDPSIRGKTDRFLIRARKPG